MDEVKRGRGRPPKDQTIIEGFDGENGEPKQEKKKVNRSAKHNVANIAETLNTVFNAFSGLCGRECNYTTTDYETEAAGLVRLIDKFPFVGNVFTLLDPLIVVMSLWNKFKGMKPKPKQEKPHTNPHQSQAPNIPGNVVTMPNQQHTVIM